MAVIDIPKEVATHLGGLTQLRVKGTINGVDFTSNTMPAGGGVLALSLSKKLRDGAGLKVGQKADVDVERI